MKTGRPKVNISKDEFEKLCSMQCTLLEIAGWFSCSDDTIENWCKETYGETFSECYKKKSAKGKISLRRSQFQAAEAGSASMLIWLGKQYLGQKDYQDVTLDNRSTDDTIRKMNEYFNNNRE